MYDLIIYNTSNFENFPIGGQITSIRNFLKYIANEEEEFCKRVLLVGVSTTQSRIGEIQKIEIDDVEFDFLPMMYRSDDLSNVKKSLRVEFLKALIRGRKMIPSNKQTVHYIHTPEAFIEVKVFHPFAKTVVFSHGSFFNMISGFRFYKNNKIIHYLFNKFLVFLLKKSDLIFTLDKISTEQYMKYTKKVMHVNNSIVLPDEQMMRKKCHLPVRLLFVGRLSKVKRVDEIIKAMELLNERAILTIVGDGEEYENLEKLIKTNALEDRVKLKGVVPPSEIGNYMKNSDVLIMNSSFEGKPMTILEAMSYGLPVITTPVGGIPEMVEKNKNAEYTDGTSKEICEAVFKIAKKYEEYEKNALLNSKKFDYKVVNKQIFSAIYNEIKK